MRILTLALAAVASLVAAPALAQGGGWYAGGDFGATVLRDIDVPTSGGETVVETEYGSDTDAFVGLDFGSFRIEGEVGYKKVDVASLDPSSGPSVEGAGAVSVTSFMANVMMDFGDDEEATQFFLGAGVGTARVRLDGVRPASASVNTFDGDEDGMAWQVFGGGRVPINERTDLKLTYRYFSVNNIEIQSGSSTIRDVDVSSHSVQAGVVIKFGPR